MIGILDVPARERKMLMCVVTHNLTYHARPLKAWFEDQAELRELDSDRPCWLWTTRGGYRVTATDAEVVSVAALIRLGLVQEPWAPSSAEQVRPTREALPLIRWLSDNGGWSP